MLSVVAEEPSMSRAAASSSEVGRWQRAVGRAAHLTLLGARHVVLDPGAWSSQRHWHDGEDELLVMLSGKAVLIEDDSETLT